MCLFFPLLPAVVIKPKKGTLNCKYLTQLYPYTTTTWSGQLMVSEHSIYWHKFYVTVLSSGGAEDLIVTVTRPSGDNPKFDPRYRQEILPFSKPFSPALRSTVWYPTRTGGHKPGVKRPGREINDWPKPSAEIKNKRSHTSTPLLGP